MALVPLYRLRNGAEHFYTISADERDGAIANYGYISEGIACYVNDVAAPSSDSQDNESFWTTACVSALSSLLITHKGTFVAEEISKQASDIADAMLIVYSNAARRLRGQA